MDVSRTGYTGDLGYEIWIPWNEAPGIWDTLMSAGRAFDIHATGMLALDIARIEAGLLLIDVDFNISEAARRLGMHRRTLARKLEKRQVK